MVKVYKAHKIEIVDDCLAPEKFVFVRYEGDDPWGVWQFIDSGIEPHFHVSASGHANFDFRWDISDDPEITFFSRWWVKKDASNHSKIVIIIKLQGGFNKTTNKGTFVLTMNADLKTSFEGWSILLKPAWYIYSYLFYNKQRRRMIQRCRDLTEGFQRIVKDHYGLKATTVPTSAVMD